MKQEKNNSPKSLYFGAKDVMRILECSSTFAYNVIRKLREEVEKDGFYDGKPGHIRKSYFAKRYGFTMEELDEILQDETSKKAG